MLLHPWISHRRDNPGHLFWKHHTVMGQHSAWTDKVIACWTSDHIAKYCPQALLVVDCLDAQWSDQAVYRCWSNQQMLMPVVPDGTSYLQGPDVGLHRAQKSVIKRQNADIHLEGEVAALQSGTAYNPAWGPIEMAETMGRTAEVLAQRNDQDKFVLQTGLGTQMWIYRPDANGFLQLVDGQPWCERLHRMPPSKGIKPAWAEARTGERINWPGAVPPAPDFTKLDAVDWVQPEDPDEPDEEDAVIDVRVRDLGLTPELLFGCRGVEQRLLEMDIPENVARRQRGQKGIKKRVGRLGKWGKQFCKTRFQKHAQRWRQKLRDGQQDELEKEMTPQSSKGKLTAEMVARLLFISRQAPESKVAPGKAGGTQSKRKPGFKVAAAKFQAARQKGTEGEPAPVETPAPSKKAAAEIEGHPWIGQSVRVTSDLAMEQFVGLVATVQKVSAVTGLANQLHCISETRTGKCQVFNIDQVQCQLVAEEGEHINAAPFKMDCRQLVAKMFVTQLADRIIGNSDPSTLELVQGHIRGIGTLVEMQTAAAILAEVEFRVPVPNARIIWPSEASSLAVPGELNPGELDNLQAIAIALQASCHVDAMLWASMHYTVITLSRPSVDDAWAIQYFDSMLGHAPSREAAERFLRRLGLLGPEEHCPPHCNTRGQNDGWSCSLHSARRVEESRRQARGEVRLPIQGLGAIKNRGNEFIQKLREAKTPDPKGKGKGKGEAPAPKATDLDKDPPPVEKPKGPQTLVEALEAAEHCSKCRTRQSATKGCAQCTGQFWAELQVRRRKASNLATIAMLPTFY